MNCRRCSTATRAGACRHSPTQRPRCVDRAAGARSWRTARAPQQRRCSTRAVLTPPACGPAPHRMNILIIEDDPRIADFWAAACAPRATGSSWPAPGRRAWRPPAAAREVAAGGTGAVLIPTRCRRHRRAGDLPDTARARPAPRRSRCCRCSGRSRIGRRDRACADDYLAASTRGAAGAAEALARRGRWTGRRRRRAGWWWPIWCSTANAWRPAAPVISALTARTGAAGADDERAGPAVQPRAHPLHVRGASEDPLTNVVDVYIRRLRAKIDEGHRPAADPQRWRLKHVAGGAGPEAKIERSVRTSACARPIA